jgi:RNA polymerase sigma-70 factor (ECF subfamily)
VPAPEEITRLLKDSGSGDRVAFDALLPLVYAELRKIADGYMRRQSPGHTLQPTALLHEAYMKLAGSGSDYKDRGHFYTVAAAVMRHILVDHARASGAEKRGGGVLRVQMEEAAAAPVYQPEALILLNQAIDGLGKVDARKAQILDLRYFGGFSVEETAEALGLSVATVGREARFAEAWLRRELEPPPRRSKIV